MLLSMWSEMTLGSYMTDASPPAQLQDPFLNVLRKEKVPVAIYLVSGIKLQGQIESFDQFVIVLKNTVNQMVYKHAISTVVPARQVRVPMIGTGENGGVGTDDDGPGNSF